jgi:hypothetical protein
MLTSDVFLPLVINTPVFRVCNMNTKPGENEHSELSGNNANTDLKVLNSPTILALVMTRGGPPIDPVLSNDADIRAGMAERVGT